MSHTTSRLCRILFSLTLVLFLPSLLCAQNVAPIASDTTENFDEIAENDTLPADSTAADLPLPERLRQLLDNDIFQRTQVGLYVYDLTADTLVFAHNERQCLRPASTQKLVTAITALRTLGTDYTLRTRLYLEGEALDSDSVYRGNIYVRAGYDPLFDRDDMRAFASALVERGLTKLVGKVYLDLTFKDSKRLGWGWCWDDDEVPLTPLLFQNKDTFVQQMRRVFAESGIEWDGATDERVVPADAVLVCTRTHTIDQVLLPMLKQSDNSMAESLFYQLAAHGGRHNAGRRQAVSHVENLISHVGLNPSHYQIADGSGLSLYNYLTPELLGRLLRYAYERDDIYRHLCPSLPVAAEDGSLRRRMKGTSAAGNVQAKTGTVEGVSTLAGYCTAADGNRLCFAIMNQGIRHTSTGRNFQDRVCKALTR